MPVVSYDDGVLSTDNALATGAGWAITWVVQVMPLAFFAAGAAAAMSLDARTGPGAASGWLVQRLVRIGRPVIPLAALWLALPPVLIAAGLPAQPVEVASALVGRLLWFLAVCVLLLISTPALLRLHATASAGRSSCSARPPSPSTSSGSAYSTVPSGSDT